MLIGILYEGELDIKPISRLVERLADECGIQEVIDFSAYPASGQTLPKFLPAALKFKQENVDIFITHIDTDGDSSRKKTFDTLVKTHESVVLGMECVALMADPHFENFYFREEAAIKRLFGIDGGDSLSQFGDTPKNILENLIKKCIPDQFEFKKNSVIYEHLMSNLDLSVLAQRDDGYRDFRQEIIKAFNVCR
jgi:hypothetical protein